MLRQKTSSFLEDFQAKGIVSLTTDRNFFGETGDDALVEIRVEIRQYALSVGHVEITSHRRPYVAYGFRCFREAVDIIKYIFAGAMGDPVSLKN